jgi:hypothetical protein
MRFVPHGHSGNGFAPLARQLSLAGQRSHSWRSISHRNDGGRNSLGGVRFGALNQRELRHIHDFAS